MIVFGLQKILIKSMNRVIRFAEKSMFGRGYWALRSRILGPHFFEGNLNGNAYLDFLQNTVIPEINQLNIPYQFIFMHNGCPAHGTDVVGRDYWYSEAGKAVDQRLHLMNPHHLPAADSVVVLVGDGLGLTTATAARILKQQRKGHLDTPLSWDTFPAVALAKTYNLDAQTGESSACATALACGVKTNFETVGLDAKGKFQDCFSSLHSRVDSIMVWAQKEGKSTGLVTNTRVSHATPAAFYAHSPSRYWEDDGKVPPKARKSCKDITRQLIEDEPGRNLNVILGGGRRHWLPKVAQDPEQTSDEGRRLDGRNLIDDWLREKKKRGLQAEYVWNTEQLANLSISSIDYLLGLFSYSHMDFEAERDQSKTGDPSLAEMAAKALKILMKNPQGFILFVERCLGGRIDHAHHYNNPYRALDETLVLDDAVTAVLAAVDLTRTLVVVTSDHSHVLTMGSLATPLSQPILGVDMKPSDVDGLTYSILLYGNGPGHSIPRPAPSNQSEVEKNAMHSSAVPRQWATHGGEDVPVYALGPLARELFSGTIDQSFIPHLIAYITCLGPQKARCLLRQNMTSTSSGECTVTENPNARNVAVVFASSVMSDDNSVSSATLHPPINVLLCLSLVVGVT